MVGAFSEEEILHFKEEGYVIQRGVYSASEMRELFLTYYDLCYHQAKRCDLLRAIDTPPPP